MDSKISKEVITNASYGAKEYLLAAMFSKETQKLDPKAAQATVLKGSENYGSVGASLRANGEQLPSQLQGLTPST